MRYPKDHYSYSAFNKFSECPRRWWFDYVRYPDEKQDIFAFVLGNAYHDAIAQMYKGDSLQTCLEVFDKQIMGTSVSVALNKDVEGIRQAIEYYHTVIYPQYRGRVAEVEVDQTVKIPGIDVDFVFRMDLETTDGVLIDHKTVGGRAPSIKYNEQLDIYAYIYMLRVGRLPRQVELHLAYKNAKGKERVEIKSNTPQLAQVLKTISKVKSTLKMIEIDSFPCRQGSACRWCPFTRECDNFIISSDGDDVI